MKRNFQLGNVLLSSQEGEKADYICMLDGMRILIYFDVRLASEGFKLEDSSIWDLSRVHTGAPWDSESAAWLPSADVQQEVIEEAQRTPLQATGPLPGAQRTGFISSLHLCSKCENLAAPCCPQEFYLLQWQRKCFRKSHGLPSTYQRIRCEELLFFQSMHCISHHHTNRLKVSPSIPHIQWKEKQASFSHRKFKILFPIT